jgi:hypothetical protein
MKSSAPALELGTESEGEKVMRHGESDLMRVGLAVAAMEDGERVFILETDRQGTISNWAARRTNPEPVGRADRRPVPA